MAPKSVGELICSQGSGTDLGAAKAQIAAKLAGLTLQTKSDSAAVHPVELKLPHGTLFGENAIARHIAIAAEAGLYPANVHDEQSRHSAAAIDGWVEFSAYEIQWRLGQLLAATSAEAAAEEEQKLAQALNVLEQKLHSRTYLVDDALSLADIMLVCDLVPAFGKVIDESVRATIPNTVRWFTTLTQHPCFKGALGPVSMATAPFTPAGASSGGQGSSSNSKKPKEGKKGKPKKASKAGLPNGDAAGRAGEEKKKTKLGVSTKKADNFGAWYSEVVVEAELISYYDVSGCYILRPNSFFIWEVITAFFDAKIKKLGVQNCQFPLFVTEDKLNTEKDHVEGFAAEVAWVTKAGSSDLERPIAIRPTSETVMYPAYADWIRSHRDLPLRLNQWTNVVRWEFKHPTPFIRTREFLWQEGHTAFATYPEAEEEVYQILDLYARVYTELLAVPVKKGRKSEMEKFAGALFTTSVEAFVPATGKGVQGGTSHCLGQNFSKMFNIQYETDAVHTDASKAKQETDAADTDVSGAQQKTDTSDANVSSAKQKTNAVSRDASGTKQENSAADTDASGAKQKTDAASTDASGAKHGPQKEFVWQNSWGLSTRTIGVMIMVHGDDKGLVMPPRVAPLQVVVIPIPATTLTDAQRQELKERTQDIVGELKGKGLRIHTDDRDNYRPGWKYNHWELKGVPLRLELGMKDVEKRGVMVARRDTGAKEVIPFADVAARVPALLEQIQADMFKRATDKFDDCIDRAFTKDEFMAALDKKHMVLAPWADEVSIEEQVRKFSATEATAGAKTLCIPLEQDPLNGAKCFFSGKPAKNWALWGRSY